MDSIYNQSTIKTQAPAQPVLSRSRGFVVDLSEMERGYRAPQIDSRGFLAAEQGLGQIGEGLESLGSSFGQLQEKMAEVVNTKHLTESELIVQQAKKDLAARIAREPDPAKWAGMAVKGGADLQGLVVTKEMSPKVRRLA